MPTLWRSQGVFLGLKEQKRRNEPTVPKLHPMPARLQKLRRRTAFSPMLIYIALNLAVILTERETSRV